MANLHVIVEPTTDIKKSMDALMVSVSNIKRSTESVVVSILNLREPKESVLPPVVTLKDSRDTMVYVLERAADDPHFIARLTYEGAAALREYDLTWEEKAAILRGDIKWIEGQVGPLDDRLRTWLWCRLQQEIW
jgi:hypothetical protein